MPFRTRGITRDLCAAFAVLVFYALTLLVPLHQTANLQRDLNALGFTTTAWSICTPLVKDTSGTPSAIKCPVSGIAKAQLAAIEPPAVEIGIVRPVEQVIYRAFVAEIARSPLKPTSQPRAPPVIV